MLFRSIEGHDVCEFLARRRSSEARRRVEGGSGCHVPAPPAPKIPKGVVAMGRVLLRVVGSRCAVSVVARDVEPQPSPARAPRSLCLPKGGLVTGRRENQAKKGVYVLGGVTAWVEWFKRSGVAGAVERSSPAGQAKCDRVRSRYRAAPAAVASATSTSLPDVTS